METRGLRKKRRGESLGVGRRGIKRRGRVGVRRKEMEPEPSMLFSHDHLQQTFCRSCFFIYRNNAETYFWFALNQAQSDSVYHFFDWFGTKWNSVWFRINWKTRKTIRIHMINKRWFLCVNGSMWPPLFGVLSCKW